MRPYVSVAAVGVAVALYACGGGNGAPPSAGSTSSPNPSPQAHFYQPLATKDSWAYSCRDVTGGGENGGRPFTIRNAVVGTIGVNGQPAYEFALQIPQIPSAPLQIVTEIQLLANDARGNVTLYGYLIGGNVDAVTPTLFVTANPPGQQHEAFNYPGPAGTTIDRTFFGLESSNPTPLGTYQVAPYFESSATHNYGYAAGTGIVEEDHGPNDEVDCLISAVALH